MPGKRPIAQGFRCEAGLSGHSYALDPLRSDLMDGHGERVAIDQIPGVAGELASYVFDDAAGAEDFDLVVACEEDAQQMIEADEMVHVRVRNENLADLEEDGGRLTVDAAEIEQQGPSVVTEADVQAGIAERGIDESRYEGRLHDSAGIREAAAWRKGVI